MAAKQNISIRLPVDLVKRADAKAQREDSDRTRVISDAVEAYLLPKGHVYYSVEEIQRKFMPGSLEQQREDEKLGRAVRESREGHGKL